MLYKINAFIKEKCYIETNEFLLSGFSSTCKYLVFVELRVVTWNLLNITDINWGIPGNE